MAARGRHAAILMHPCKLVKITAWLCGIAVRATAPAAHGYNHPNREPKNNFLRQHYRPSLPRVSWLACTAIAGCALLGWVSGIGRLTSVFPGFPTMVPITALLTLCACAALWRLDAAGATVAAEVAPAAPPRALAAAGLLTAAALAILLAHLAGWAPPPFVLRAHGLPLGVWGVSSPITAFMFGALGAALLALGLTARRWRSACCCLRC